MAQTVIGFFDSASEAREACEMLKRQGFTEDQIDLRSNNLSNSSSDQLVGGQKMDDTGRTDHREEKESGITRFFKSLFGDNDDEADRYSRVGKNSGAIVTVHARSNDDAERAADILDESGAVDVDERSEQYASTSGQYGSTDRTGEGSLRGDELSDRNRTSSDAGVRNRNLDEKDSRSEDSIQRVEENLEVGKREVERGGVRLRSRIVERPVEEHVRLREEHVNIERTAVDRPVTGNRDDLFRETDIELTERAEVPVVNKEARVVEEIRVSKDVEEHDETVRDTVRRTEVDVDKLDGDQRNVSGTNRQNENRTDRNNDTQRGI